MKKNTVIFEAKYNVDIKDFSTTEDIDKFLEKEAGRKLEVIVLDTDLVTNRGGVFKMLNVDIDALFDESIEE